MASFFSADRIPNHAYFFASNTLSLGNISIKNSPPDVTLSRMHVFGGSWPLSLQGNSGRWLFRHGLKEDHDSDIAAGRCVTIVAGRIIFQQ